MCTNLNQYLLTTRSKSEETLMVKTPVNFTSISAVTLHIKEYEKEMRSADILRLKTKGQILLFSLLLKYMLSQKNTLYG